MKKVVLAVALLIGVVSLSKAQGGGGQGRNMGTPEERAARSLAQLPEDLKLSDAQKASITAIYLAQNKKTDSLRTAANGDFASIMPKFQEMRTATDQKIGAVMTDEQKPKYEAYLKNRPQFGRGGQGGGGGQGGQRPPQN